MLIYFFIFCNRKIYIKYYIKYAQDMLSIDLNTTHNCISIAYLCSKLYLPSLILINLHQEDTIDASSVALVLIGLGNIDLDAGFASFS